MPTHVSHTRKATGVVALLLALVAAMALSMSATTPTANAATKCSVKGKKLGPTYTTALTVSGTSCKQGYSLVTAWHKCRMKKGKKGRCTSKVLSYTCTEKRTNAIPTQFDASVSCKKGKARITHKYTQYT